MSKVLPGVTSSNTWQVQGCAQVRTQQCWRETGAGCQESRSRLKDSRHTVCFLLREEIMQRKGLSCGTFKKFGGLSASTFFRPSSGPEL